MSTRVSLALGAGAVLVLFLQGRESLQIAIDGLRGPYAQAGVRSGDGSAFVRRTAAGEPIAAPLSSGYQAAVALEDPTPESVAANALAALSSF